MVAGTRTMRTMVASSSTATARPRPNSLSWRSSPSTKLPKTQTMISAAAVMTRAVTARPSATADCVVAGPVVLLLDAGEEEHLVVHRQAEHDGEQHHRHPGLDRTGPVDADQVLRPAPLEDRDHDPVGRADRQQVDDHRLERHQEAAEHQHQQQERQHQHRGHDQREAIGQERREVDVGGGEAAHLGVASRSRGRTFSRRSLTRSDVSSSWGAPVGDDRDERRGLVDRSAREHRCRLPRSIRCSPSDRPCRILRSRRDPEPGRSSGPLKPGPKPLASRSYA